MTRLLEICDVSKGFPGVQALDGVNLELSRGEVLALVGENGAGKSTLMKILSGIHSRDEGSITIEGRSVDVRGPREAQELGISIIHQELNLLPHLTVAQNIYLGREPRRGPFVQERVLRRRAQELLDGLGISLSAAATVGELTVAQQQMVEIAKALSFDETKILIMDEPTSAISLAETAVLFGLIRSLRERGVGIVYISHRMEELREIADRVTVLRDGQYVGTSSLDAITDAEIISMMVGRDVPETIREIRRAEGDGASQDVLLRVRGLSTRALLHDVSFDLHRGEILGFAGLIGAGRTETARAVIGADSAVAGSVEVRGEPVEIAGPHSAVRHGIGYLPEDRKQQGLMLDQSIVFNVAMASLRRLSNAVGFVRSSQARREAKSSIESLAIKAPSEDAVLRNLSGGNQQKVVIAKWLTRDCEMLIFDEPTRGIDVGAKEEIYEILRHLADSGKGVIVISSELPEILRLSDRVLVMSEGQVSGVLAADEADQERVMQLATMSISEGGAA